MEKSDRAKEKNKKSFTCKVGEEKMLSNGDWIRVLDYSFIRSRREKKLSKSRLELKLDLSGKSLLFEMVNLSDGGFSLIQSRDLEGRTLYQSPKWSMRDLCEWAGNYVGYSVDEIGELYQLVKAIRTCLLKNIIASKPGDFSDCNCNANENIEVVKAAALAFIKNVQPLEPFNQLKWFQGAYQTMQRTKIGGVPPEIRKQIMCSVFEEIEKLRSIRPCQEAFDDWFFNGVQKICLLGALTFGQGQKIVNILLKYYYCYYYSGLDSFWNKENNYLESVFCFFHAPVDSIILQTLKLKYDDAKIGFVKTTAQGPRFVEEDTHVPWSKLQNIESYCKLQCYIGELAQKHQVINDRITFEMLELWNGDS